MKNAKRVKVGLAIIVIASGTVLWMVQLQHKNRLRAENGSLRLQLERMEVLESDNLRLSNIVAQYKGKQPNQQLMELLRLRNEVGMLRRQTNELQKQFEQTVRHLSGVAQSESQNSNPPPANQVLEVFPKASWKFAGYDTPEDAFQSLNWAAMNGDFKSMLTNCTAEMQNEFTKSVQNKSESEIINGLKSSFENKTEASILERQDITDNLVVLVVSDDRKTKYGQVRSDKLVFQKVNGEWKLAEGH